MAWWEANPGKRSKGRKSSARKWTWGGWGTGGSKTRAGTQRKTVRKVAKTRARKSFFAHWGGRQSRPGWKSEGRAHAVAAKIGWTYRKYARSFAKFGSYAARGTRRGKHKGLRITPRSLSVYRKARRTPLSRLEGRREWFKHKTTGRKTYASAMVKSRRKFGMLYNASSYQKFVAKFTKGARGRGEARRRFKAAAAAWRRNKKSRKNPVLPISYNSNGKRRKSRKSRSNPLFRTAVGRFSKRGGRRLRRIKGGGWHNNRRSLSNSPILPYTAYSNPMAAVAGTFKEMTDISMWTKTILPLTAGYIGTHAVAVLAVKFIMPSTLKFEGVVKHGVRALSAAALSVGVGLVTKDSDMAAKVLAGGLVAVLGGVLSDVIGDDFKKMTGLGEMDYLADDLTEDLKARIADGVRRQFSDYDNGMDGNDDDTISSFVTTEDLNRAPRLGDFVSSEALKRATVGTDMPGRVGGGPPREGNALADLGTFQDAQMDGSLI